MKTEANLINMTGVIPADGAGPIPVGKIPDDGTQIAKSGIATNATVVVYTVTAGKTLYLSAFTFYTYNTSGATQVGSMYVQDTVPAIQYIPVSAGIINNFGNAFSSQFLPPLEIAAGWRIVVVSPAANFSVGAFIHGYEV